MYTCREIEKLLDIYTDGELDERRRLRVEAHLRDCVHCKRLVHFRENEAQLIRCSDPVPALSPGFTRQVMSSLTQTERSPARGERFFSLGTVFTRPWLAPALAGLLMLVTVSWAVSRHLITASPGMVALQSQPRVSQAPPTAGAKPDGQISRVLLDDYSMNTTNYDSTKIEDNTVKDTVKNTVKVKAPFEPDGVKAAAKSDSSRATTPASQEKRAAAGSPEPGGTPAGNPEPGETGTGSPEPGGTATGSTEPGGTAADQALPGSKPADTQAPRMMSLSQQDNLAELERQGYTVFKPDYLPPGYSFEAYSLQPLDEGKGSDTRDTARDAMPVPGKSSLQLAYRNAQTGRRMTLEILPLNGPVPQSGPDLTKAPAGQPAGASQITWYAQKHGNNFMLRVTGSVPPAELRKVADSVQ